MEEKPRVPKTRMGLGKEADLDDPKTWHHWMSDMGHPRIERLYELRRDHDELKTVVEQLVKVVENLAAKVTPL